MNIKQKARDMFDEKFAQISHVHRGETVIMDTTGTKFQVHLDNNGKVTEIGGLECIKDFIDQIIDMAIAERDKDTESKLDEVWGILCDMDTNIKSEKEYAKDIINLIIPHQDR